MKQNNQKLTIANKIKKWIQTTKEIENSRFAISITRLTSIKSLCADKIAAEKFALYIAKQVQKQRNQATRPENFSDEEWEQQKQVVDEAIAQMEINLENPTAETQQPLIRLLKIIDSLQG
ncbi:MAG TPA: hypothetical protein VK211_15220, partial [Kamptonema sp.]|nr:hypothetical protein [Kamptonema sp.]